jgi:S1-C subfamily serine protease
MGVLDLVLLLLLVAFGYAGYRRGFIVGAAGFAGFVGGGAFGMLVLPQLLGGRAASVAFAGVSLIGVLLCAAIGQALASWVGSLVRSQVSWEPVRVLDAAAGSLLSVAAVLLVAWFLALALVQGPFPALTSQVRDSRVLGGIDAVMPDGARELFSDFQSSLDDSVFPRVFGGLGGEQVAPVGEPDTGLLNEPAIKAVRRSVVEIDGLAESCSEQITGTGFVVAPNRVVTNAHVVAGVDAPIVHTNKAGFGKRATVVFFDPKVDLAVLAVPGLDAPALELSDEELRRGDDAVVVGFPGGGPYTKGAARVRDRQQARGRDIYDSAPVTREVYALRATVRPGNSGGPLVNPDGSVAGVVFAASVDDDDTGYALTMDEVRSDIDAGVAATSQGPTGRCA